MPERVRYKLTLVPLHGSEVLSQPQYIEAFDLDTSDGLYCFVDGDGMTIAVFTASYVYSAVREP